MMRRRLGSVLAAVLLGTTAGAAGPGSAQAASGYCPQGEGVTVVVDNGSLGGGSSVSCDPDGEGTAASTVVPRAGYALSYVTGSGFVCRVAGRPGQEACGRTPPADAYWGLFWSDGKSGKWNYSDVGVGSLKVPAGGFIGWRFQGSSRTAPGPTPVSPKAATPEPSSQPTASEPAAKPPSSRPTPRPTSSPSASRASSPAVKAATGPRAAASTGATTPTQRQRKQAAAQERKAARTKAKARARAKASSSSSATPTAGSSSASASPAADPDTNLVAGEQATDNGSGPMLPLVAAGLLVALLGAAGRLLWVRRRG